MVVSKHASDYARKPYSGLSRSLVIAIDVGTTFSGVSYAILEPGEIPKIHGITRFPGQEHVAGNSKIPSIIYYDRHGSIMVAGAEADSSAVVAQAEDEGWIKTELFKLRLRPRTMQLNMNGMRLTPLPKRKTPVHVFGDYLGYLFECTKSFITDTHANGHHLWREVEPAIEFVLSHPNGWEGPQQTRMRNAAVHGGLVPDTDAGRARIRFVTEGEASLHACVLSGLASEVLSKQSKNGFLIADAGGGTLDISAYAIKGTQPLAMEEIAPPDCIFAGSVFVSRRARDFFAEKLKNSRYGSADSVEHITRRFDETTKRLFRDRNELQFVPFGSPLDKELTVGVRNGQLKLSGAEVANLFEPSVDAAVQAIKKQIRISNGLIKSVFLVGGYAASPWLFTQLQERLAPYGVSVSRPDTQTSKAVADGAVGFYCDHHVSARMSKFMYGVEFLRELNPEDPEHVARKGKLCELPSGPKLLPDAFDCILARGVKVKESMVFTRKYCTELTNLSLLSVFEVEIWCFRGPGDKPPLWIDRHDEFFSTLCVVQADLSMLSGSAEPKSGRNGKKYWTIVFSVEIHFGLTEFKARIKWQDNGKTKYGPAVIVYNERGHRIEDDDVDPYPEDDASLHSSTRSPRSPRTPSRSEGGHRSDTALPPSGLSRSRTPQVDPSSGSRRSSTVGQGMERTSSGKTAYSPSVSRSGHGYGYGYDGEDERRRESKGKEREGGSLRERERERDRESLRDRYYDERDRAISVTPSVSRGAGDAQAYATSRSGSRAVSRAVTPSISVKSSIVAPSIRSPVVAPSIKSPSVSVKSPPPPAPPSISRISSVPGAWDYGQGGETPKSLVLEEGLHASPVVVSTSVSVHASPIPVGRVESPFIPPHPSPPPPPPAPIVAPTPPRSPFLSASASISRPRSPFALGGPSDGRPMSSAFGTFGLGVGGGGVGIESEATALFGDGPSEVFGGGPGGGGGLDFGGGFDLGLGETVTRGGGGGVFDSWDVSEGVVVGQALEEPKEPEPVPVVEPEPVVVVEEPVPEPEQVVVESPVDTSTTPTTGKGKKKKKGGAGAGASANASPVTPVAPSPIVPAAVQSTPALSPLNPLAQQQDKDKSVFDWGVPSTGGQVDWLGEGVKESPGGGVGVGLEPSLERVPSPPPVPVPDTPVVEEQSVMVGGKKKKGRKGSVATIASRGGGEVDDVKAREEEERKKEEERVRKEEEERLRKEEEERLKREEEERLKREEEDRLKREEEEKARKEEEERMKQEEERVKREEEQKRAEEARVKKEQEEEEKRRNEDIKKQQREDAKKQKEEEKKRKEEEKRQKEEEKRKKEEEEKRQKEEEERSRKEQIKKQKEETKKQKEDEKKRKEDEERERVRLADEEAARQRQEAERVRLEAEEREKKIREEEERQRAEEEELRRIEAELKKMEEEEAAAAAEKKRLEDEEAARKQRIKDEEEAAARRAAAAEEEERRRLKEEEQKAMSNIFGSNPVSNQPALFGDSGGGDDAAWSGWDAPPTGQNKKKGKTGSGAPTPSIPASKPTSFGFGSSGGWGGFGSSAQDPPAPAPAPESSSGGGGLFGGSWKSSLSSFGLSLGGNDPSPPPPKPEEKPPPQVPKKKLSSLSMRLGSGNPLAVPAVNTPTSAVLPSPIQMGTIPSVFGGGIGIGSGSGSRPGTPALDGGDDPWGVKKGKKPVGGGKNARTKEADAWGDLDFGAESQQQQQQQQQQGQGGHASGTGTPKFELEPPKMEESVPPTPAIESLGGDEEAWGMTPVGGGKKGKKGAKKAKEVVQGGWDDWGTPTTGDGAGAGAGTPKIEADPPAAEVEAKVDEPLVAVTDEPTAAGGGGGDMEDTWTPTGGTSIKGKKGKKKKDDRGAGDLDKVWGESGTPSTPQVEEAPAAAAAAASAAAAAEEEEKKRKEEEEKKKAVVDDPLGAEPDPAEPAVSPVITTAGPKRKKKKGGK